MNPKTALIIVDVQNDFLPPDGSLAVPNGRDVIPEIQRLLGEDWKWDIVIATQDYHPHGHISFASAHKATAFESKELSDARGDQTNLTLWPDHCVIGTPGAEIDRGLRHSLESLKSKLHIVRKGWHAGLEAYSAFEGYVTDPSTPLDNPDSSGPPPPKKSSHDTDLAVLLRGKNIDRVVVVGLATDYCVRSTALSAVEAGFKTVIYEQGIKGIDENGSREAIKLAVEKGATIVKTEDELKQMLM